MLPCRALAAAILSLSWLAACGDGIPDSQPDGGQACQRNRDCPSGMGCSNGACVAQPCGGCQADELCAPSGQCVAAQGATCPSDGCPKGYQCAGSVCAKPCTLDQDCERGSVCNSSLHACAQCTFDDQCKSVAGRPRCDAASGACVACTQPIDCARGNFCDTSSHTCKPGCLADTDCNTAAGERCDGAGASSPGRCIQCASNQDCKPGDTPTATPFCDSGGRCVQCTKDDDCPLGVHRCDLTSKTCVQCLPDHDATGQDCGCFSGGAGSACPAHSVTGDSHDGLTCHPDSRSCVQGCRFDTQCGCPRINGVEQDCARKPRFGAGSAVVSGEHCDPDRRVDADGKPSQGACVECITGNNQQCRYRIRGATGADDYDGKFANLNGARCVNDKCDEGCDADSDCPASKVCHGNRCVECSCEGATVNDNSWCADAARCGIDSAHPTPRVCDARTLSCRPKRFGETCGASNECGDTLDPTVGACVPVPAICVKEFRPDANSIQDFRACSTAPLPNGRCGIPCSDTSQNICAGGDFCPGTSLCRSAKDDALTSGKYCVPSACR